MNKSITIGIVLLSGVLSTSLANAVVINVYTDRTTWESALSGATISTETFSNPIAAADVINLDNGIVSTASPAGRTGTSYNRVSGGEYIAYNCLTICSFAPTEYDWALPSSVIAVGGDFVDANSGGLELNIDALGFSGNIFSALGGGSGFYGIISDTSFNNIDFRCSSSCGDFWELDNFSSAVPEPGTFALLGLGLAGLGFARRKKA